MRKLFLVALIVLLNTSLNIANALTHVVVLVTEKTGKYSIFPEVVYLKKGDKINWVNAQDDEHQLESIKVPDGAATFKSKKMKKKGQSFSYRFTHRGKYTYHCALHKDYKNTLGVIIVK